MSKLRADKPLAGRIMSIVVIALIVRAIVPASFKAAIRFGEFTRVDASQYYEAAHRLNEGATLYPADLFGYPNPPLIAILLRPAASRLSLDQFIPIWTAVQVLCLLSAAIVLVFTVRGYSLLPMSFIVIALFRNWPTVLELGVGNIECMILLCYCIATAAVSRRAWWIAGIAVAIAGNLKLWALGLGFGFVLCRQYRIFIGCCLGCVALIALQMPVVGWASMMPFIRRQIGYSSQPVLVSNSVPGLARLLFRPNPISQPWAASNTLYLLTIITGASITGYTLYRAAGYFSAGSERSNVVLFCSTIPAMLILHPLAHIYVYTLLTAPLTIIACYSAEKSSSRAMKALILCVTVYLVMSLTLPGSNPLPHWAQSGAGILVIGVWPLLAMGILIATIDILRTESDSTINTNNARD